MNKANKDDKANANNANTGTPGTNKTYQKSLDNRSAQLESKSPKNGGKKK